MSINRLRPPYPWQMCPPWQSGLRVVILIVVVTATVVLTARGTAPATAVAVIGAAGVATAEIAARLVTAPAAPVQGRRR